MHIGIEMRHLVPATSGGVALLLRDILTSLFARYPQDHYYIYCTIFNRSLFSETPPNVTTYSLPTHTYYIEMEKSLIEQGVDVLFRCYPNLDTLDFPLSRQVFMLPDLQHEALPELFDPPALAERARAFNRAMAGAQAIATLTEFTRQTILAHPENHCQDIFTLPPLINPDIGCGFGGADLGPALVDGDPPQRSFFFYPANLWPHKNHRRLLQAFSDFLKETGEDVELLLTGHPDGWEQLQAEFPTLPVRHLGYVSKDTLDHLYRHTIALTFFSLYEGFGIPLLEAFAHDTPVICANTTSLPEVGGQAVLSCDPLDNAAMSAAMQVIYQDSGLRHRLIEAGRARLDHYCSLDPVGDLHAALERVSLAGGESAPLREFPLVSIVTPSYNQAEFLGRSIDSVLAQNYPNLEYIVIDGGSTDGSVAVLQSYGARFPWVSEKDRGQTDAVNKGLARCHGEILAFVNSDDELEPGAVEKVVRFFQEHPEIDMVYGRATYIDENDQVIGMYNTAEYSKGRLLQDNCVCQPAAFWRRRIADQIGPWTTDLHYAMDFEYWLRIANAGGGIAHTHAILARSRLHQNTKTTLQRGKIIGEVFVVSKQQAGYVDKSYIQGLWYFRGWQLPHSPYRFIKNIPGSYRVIVNVHYLVINWDYLLVIARRKGPRWILRQLSPADLSRRLARLARNTLGFLRPLVRRWRAHRALVSAEHPVFGLWPDNWLGPVAQFYVSQPAMGEKPYLVVSAALDIRTKVLLDDILVEEFLLTADSSVHPPQKITLDAQPGQVITLTCDRSIKDSQSRNVAMRIVETNLFLEHKVFFPPGESSR